MHVYVFSLSLSVYIYIYVCANVHMCMFTSECVCMCEKVNIHTLMFLNVCMLDNGICFTHVLIDAERKKLDAFYFSPLQKSIGASI